MHAEIRPDVNGVMVSGDVLLIGPRGQGAAGPGAGAAPPRGRHPPRHPGQRRRTSRSRCSASGSRATTRRRRAWPSSPRSPVAGSPRSGCASSPAGSSPCTGSSRGRRSPRPTTALRRRRTSRSGSAFTTVMRVYRVRWDDQGRHLPPRPASSCSTHLARGRRRSTSSGCGKFSLRDLPLIGELQRPRAAPARSASCPVTSHDPAAARRIDLARSGRTRTSAHSWEGQP